MAGEVRCSEQGGVARVMLSHPPRFNAMTRSMWRELKDVFVRLQADTAVRCVLLCGEGPSFCSGRDTAELGQRAGGESDVAVGFHAIEFLLWGQDMNASGPGQRPATDYVTTAGGTAANQARRGQVLTTVNTVLTQHLADLASEWAEGGAYRATFTTEFAPAEALRNVVFGLVQFSGAELGGERVVALDRHDQEDEHSCFSDNTHRDFVMDVIGIENVYLGRYVRTDGTVVSGTGLYDVVARVDVHLANSLRDRIATSVALALAIRAPYDQEIAAGNVAGNARVAALRASLQAQRLLFIDVASVMNLPDPEL